MKYLRIFLLNFQYVFAHPSKIFVWFLVVIIAPLANMIFWIAAISTNRNIGFTTSFITSYYLLQIFFSTLLMWHRENDVGREDIQGGYLSQYLLKPFSYFWINFFKEFPYRIIEGFFGFAVLIIFFTFFERFIKITQDPIIFIGSIILAILGSAISFIFKMNLGLTAFWTTDTHGTFGYVDILIIIFAGYIMPISLFPYWLQQIAYILPFSYMIYFPVIAFQGGLSSSEIMRVIATQSVWLVALTICYKIMWKQGLRKFTALGQ